MRRFVYSKCKRSSPALFNETFSVISYIMSYFDIFTLCFYIEFQVYHLKFNVNISFFPVVLSSNKITKNPNESRNSLKRKCFVTIVTILQRVTDMCYATTILTASNVTRMSSPTIAMNAAKSLGLTPKICHTKKNTGTRPVLSAPNVAHLQLTSNLVPKPIGSTVDLATMLSLPRVVMDVAMYSEQVNISKLGLKMSKLPLAVIYGHQNKKIVTRTFVNVSEYSDV